MSVYIDPPKFEEEKLCIHCKHSAHVRFSGWQCRHPNSDAWIISKVDGEIVRNSDSKWMAWCNNARESNGQCKSVGKYFERIPTPEPKQKWYHRLMRRTQS